MRQGRKPNVVDIEVKKVDLLSSGAGGKSVVVSLDNKLAMTSRDFEMCPRAGFYLNCSLLTADGFQEYLTTGAKNYSCF